MLFSSVIFLYFFLPVVLVFYTLAPRKLKNAVLLAASLFFYFWGEPAYLLLMVFSCFFGWGFGLIIDKYRGKPLSKYAMLASVAVGLGLLGIFKYADFIIENVNRLLGRSPATGLLALALPIGISFYTFQILSYTIDLYRGNAQVQRNFFRLATYIALFPQLVAGPIVRYTTVADELSRRRHTLADVSSGVTRFCIGLGKKVLLANVMGQLCEIYKTGREQTVLFTWIYVFAFGFQVYFDFSGYSDMAIGLGRMFGFHFLENFNYPYIAKSVTEFWRRWHISLGSWFRDYIYIPMGGNRVKIGRHIFNIMTVWFLTGLWHGAGWTYIAWGMYFGAFMLLEKFAWGKALEKCPVFWRHAYLLAIIVAGWTLFDAETIAHAWQRLELLAGIGADGFAGRETLYYLRSYLIPMVISAIGCTPLPRTLIHRLSQRPWGEKTLALLQPAALCGLVLVVTAYLIDGSYNPFIYFRF